MKGCRVERTFISNFVGIIMIGIIGPDCTTLFVFGECLSVTVVGDVLFSLIVACQLNVLVKEQVRRRRRRRRRTHNPLTH